MRTGVVAILEKLWYIYERPQVLEIWIEEFQKITCLFVFVSKR